MAIAGAAKYSNRRAPGVRAAARNSAPAVATQAHASDRNLAGAEWISTSSGQGEDDGCARHRFSIPVQYHRNRTCEPPTGPSRQSDGLSWLATRKGPSLIPFSKATDARRPSPPNRGQRRLDSHSAKRVRLAETVSSAVLEPMLGSGRARADPELRPVWPSSETPPMTY